MTTAVNDEIYWAIDVDQDAERRREAAKHAKAEERAMGTYLEILTDATRTTEADKAAFAAALKTLGFSLEGAQQDARAIKSAIACAEERAGFAAAYEELEKAKAAVRRFVEIERPAAIQKLGDDARELERRREAAVAKTKEVSEAGRILKSIHSERPHLASVLPPI
jgi:hypothetical protein